MSGSSQPAISDQQISGPVPPTAGGTVLVLLHGRGSDMHDLQGLRALLPSDWTLVTPQAVYPGAPWGYGPGWAWYRYLQQDQVVPETLEASLSALDLFLDGLPELLGGDPDRLVLGGFSQGGTTSLAYAFSRPRRVHAVLNFSGFLADGVTLPDPADSPPVFWGHGLHDPAIPYALAVRGRGKLAEAGISVLTSDHPIGHGIVPPQVADAVDLIRSAAQGV